MYALLATAAEHPNTLPIIADNPALVGGLVVVAIFLSLATKRWWPVLGVGVLFVLAVLVSSQATGGIK